MESPLEVRPVNVALSGGGHRAALFAFGVALYLADSGENRNVSSIASVSGGSITNGSLAQAPTSFRNASADDVRSATRRTVQALTHRGSFAGRMSGSAVSAMALCFVAGLAVFVWRAPDHLILGFGLVLVAAAIAAAMFTTWLACCYIAVLVLTLFGVLALPWFVRVPAVGRVGIMVAALLVWTWLLAGRRSWVCEMAFKNVLFSPDGRPTRLSSIHGDLDHVFCATELQSSEQLYLSKDFVYGYRYGKGTPGEMTLARAVQCSACLPFAFAPRWLRRAPLSFSFPTLDEPPSEERADETRYLVLTDGGVYDNMSDQWGRGFANRLRVWPSLDREHHAPTQQIVVNASASKRWAPFKRSQIPGLGEILAMLRIKDVLYDQTTAPRRRELVSDFNHAAQSASGMTGAIVDISQSPFGVADAFSGDPDWPARSARASQVIATLGESTRDDWRRETRANAQLGTTLSRMGVEQSAKLLHHGYVLAMANLHVVLGYPLLPVPSVDDMRAFVRKN